MTAPANWKEVCRHGDLYAENTADEVGMDKTAIYEVVISQFTGDPSWIIPRLEAVVAKPLPEIIIMFQAIISGVLFLGTSTQTATMSWARASTPRVLASTPPRRLGYGEFARVAA